jgi:hypothetical protein
MASLPLRGGCLCGGVRFEIDEPLVGAGYCHCKRCQRRTGTAASLNASIVPGSLRIVQGEELVRAYEPEGGWPKAFCSACGSALWSINPENPDVKGVRLGAFDEDPGIRAQWHQYVAYAAPFEPIPDDGLPRYPEGRPRR